MLFGALTNNAYAQLSENQTETIQLQDEALINTYVERVNSEQWMNLPELFCAEQEAVILAVLSEESNKTENVGIYNVTNINAYTMYEIDDYAEDEYSNYCDVAEYLLHLDCNVKESNLFFKEDDNYFRLVTGTQGGSRKILELSVAPDVLLEKIVEAGSAIVSVEDLTEYTDARSEVVNSMDDFETRVVQEYDNSNNNISIAAEYSPKTLSSYSFPNTITILKSEDNKIYSRNFKDYCYVVCSTEFSCGTDGVTTVHTEALKAFSLCVRNVGWYRSLYPYNVTAGYNVTDNTNTQAYNWSIESSVTTSYPRHASAVDAIWNVMMFDGAKNLFYPSYRSGSYNTNRDSSLSIFYQNGSNYLATELGYNFEQILHFYYDPAIGDQITSGPIIICTSHNRELAYTKTIDGHGRKCATCGYVVLTSHTWKSYVDHYECTICGYESKFIPSIVP
ncbi:MAG: SpoIID/LytB domain-containing protein [Agathobacter sp.]|nr:SpoIID/LytB domain-containing protein [Agathobacter sp.]